MSKIYRADIDGLRAFAVVSVILFHLNSNWLPNGYLGVDIFFVLSGFLITGIIYQEIAEKQFSLKQFYLRRMKRILPAFFTVLFSTLLVGYWLFEAQDFQALYKSAFSAVFFGANIYFARNAGYFDSASEEKPLLHFWSLSVEEQFYFIFPLFLLLLFKLPKLLRWKWVIFSFLLGLLLVSIVIPLPWQHYYLSHFRFIEMLSGAMLAIFVYEYRPQLSNKISLFGSGLSLTLLIFILFSEHVTTPLAYFSLFLFGVSFLVVILLFCNEKPHLISKLFSLPPVVWIGKLSYSLYLWHWVVLAFARYIYQQSELPIEWQIACFAIILCLSTLSYYFIEQPLRQAGYPFKAVLIGYCILPAITVLVFYFNIENKPYSNYHRVYQRVACYQNTEKACLFGEENSQHRMLWIGDSHTLHLFGMAEIISQAKNVNIHLSAANACPYILNYSFTSDNKDYTAFCQHRNPLFDLERLQNYSHILISNFWANQYYVKDDELYRHLEIMLEKLAGLNIPVYIVNSSGYTTYNLHRVKHFEKLGLISPRPHDVLFGQKTDTAVNMIKQRVEKHPPLTWIDLSKFIPQIVTENPDMRVFSDDNHLTMEASRKLGEMFMANYPDLFP